MYNGKFTRKAKTKQGKVCFERKLPEDKSAGVAALAMYLWFQMHDQSPYWCLGDKLGVVAR